MMIREYVAGVDIGTSGTKAVIFDSGGRPVASSYREYVCVYPHPLWVEQDATELYDAVLFTLGDALAKSEIDKEALKAIAFSTQRSCVLFLGADGEPLSNMISWQDGRTGEEAAEIEKRLGADEFFRITGLPSGTTWILPKILWYQKNEPAKWQKTKYVVQLHDYILKKCGAEAYIVPNTDNSLSGLWNVLENRYEESFVEAFDIDTAMLSQSMRMGKPIGTISRDFAEATGLSEKTLLCTGAGDQSAAALGAGVIHSGDMSVSLGTGGMMIICVEEPRADERRAFLITEHAAPRRWQWEGLQKGSAGIFRWFRDEIANEEQMLAKQTGRDVYDLLSEKAESVPPGARGLVVLPFFAASATPYWNQNARGAVIGLTFAHDRACLARAFMESITMEHKDMLENARKSGVFPKIVTIMGGPTKSELWNKIQASMYGLPVRTLKVADASVLGAAAAAATGAGIYTNLDEAVGAMVQTDLIHEPIPGWEKIYNAQYEIYREAYEDLNQRVFADLVSRSIEKGGV